MLPLMMMTVETHKTCSTRNVLREPFAARLFGSNQQNWLSTNKSGERKLKYQEQLSNLIS